MKETGVDDIGLNEFYQKYYKFPIYRDEKKETYQALGNRSISLPTWNPFKLYSGMKQLNLRMKSKGLDGNLKGEGMIQGGIFIFNKVGELQYVYEEETGSEIDMNKIIDAMKVIHQENNSNTKKNNNKA